MADKLLSYTPSGLYCEAGDFFIDSKRAVHRVLVSHAHGDHAVATSGEVFCTGPTESFMTYRFAEKRMPVFRRVAFGESFQLNEVKVTYYPAGHILGSAQILMEFEGKRYLYTGDFKIQADDTCEQFEHVPCDYLITETTFASPDYSHPDPEKEIFRILEGNDRVMIGAYALGKAQRITKLISRHFPGHAIHVHPDIENYHRIYQDHGIDLGKWKPYRRTEYRHGKSCLIVPPSYFSRYRDQTVMKVFATGWKRPFYRCDDVLQISDHADWSGILEVIQRTGARHISTVHGNGNHLKDYLKDHVEVKILGK